MPSPLLLTGLVRRPGLQAGALCTRELGRPAAGMCAAAGVGGREAGARGFSFWGTFLFQCSSPSWATSVLSLWGTQPGVRRGAGRQGLLWDVEGGHRGQAFWLGNSLQKPHMSTEWLPV